jgi:hypothetical protein
MKKKYQLKMFHFLDATPFFDISNCSPKNGTTQGLIPPDPRDMRTREMKNIDNCEELAFWQFTCVGHGGGRMCGSIVDNVMLIIPYIEQSRAKYLA